MAQLKDTTVSGNLSVSGTGNIGGPAQVSGNLTLYTASGDSPGLIFQRGSLDDNYNDWELIDSGGLLYVRQRGSGSTNFGNVLTVWNNGDIGTQKSASAYTGKFTTEALSGSQTWTFPDKTGTVALSEDIPSVTPLIGNTSDITPTQVLTALQAGRDVYITYSHELYGTIAATYFDYSNAFSVIISNVITAYNDGGQTTYMLFQLSGYLNNNTWGCHVTTLAEKSDVPTAANSNTTGITASTTATKTTLGTAGSIYGVQSGTASVRGVKTGANSTTTASKVTLGTAFSIPNPSFSDVTVPIRADSDTVVPIKNTSSTTVPIKNANPTSVPVISSNNEVELSLSMDTTDTKQLNIGWTAKPTRTVLGDSASIYGVQDSTTSVTGVQSTTTSVRGVKTGTNSTTTASKGTLGTAFTVPNVTGNTDVTVPIRADADTTVPIKNTSTISIPNVSVSSATVTITDPGHTHDL